MSHTDYLLFLDYETTGNPDHKLLEVGWMLTDSSLAKFFECRSKVIHQDNIYPISNEILKMHTDNGLVDEVAKSTCTISEAETIICENIIHNVSITKDTRIILAGFTPHYDRECMKRDMPKLDELLHYRHFDISTLRGAYHYWVENIPSKKSEHPHRVTADVIASWEIANTYAVLFKTYFPKGLVEKGLTL